MVGPFATTFRALRLPFVTASALPYIYGGLYPNQPLRAWPFALGLLAVVMTHLAANLINDYADSFSGADARDLTYYGFFGGSKLIQEGRLSRAWYLAAARICAVVAALAVAALVIACKAPLSTPLYFVAILALAWSYSHGPLRFVYRGWGEVVVFLLFGPACVAGGLFLQLGYVPWLTALSLSLPFGFLTAGILVANEVPDADDDAAAGKRTLVVRAGAARGHVLYAALAAGAFAWIGVSVLLGGASPWLLLALVTLPVAAVAVTVLRRDCGNKVALVRAAKAAVLLQALVGVALIVWGRRWNVS